MLYKTFRYIYPPRPKNAVAPSDLPFWDNGSMIAEPKLNGSNCILFISPEKVYAMNRHNQSLTMFNLTKEEIDSIYRGTGGWMVVNGEYMNKSQSDENGAVFNHKLVIFDILVLDSNYMVGSTFKQRVELLDELYGTEECDKPFLYGISENVYRVKYYLDGFSKLYEDLVKIDMYEGVVLKRANAKLELGISEMNNVKSQIKCRKKTLNYRY